MTPVDYGDRLRVQSLAVRHRSGAVLVHTVVCLVFLVIMLTGLIQYGIILHAMSTLDAYAREGARYASENWASPGFNNPSATTRGSFNNFMNGAATSGNVPYSSVQAAWISIPWNAATKSYDSTHGTQTDISDNSCSGSGCVTMASGDVFTVYVKYDMTKQYFFYPLVPGLSKSFVYTAKASMVAN